jgi:YVTN family beta-propeller protein
MGLDLSPDNSKLYVASFSSSVYEINTSTLQVSARIPFWADTNDSAFPMEVCALANGTLAILDSGTTYLPGENGVLFIYSPATGTIQNTGVPLLNMTPSADRTKLFSTEYGGVRQYDSATGLVTNYTIPGAPKAYHYGLAVRPDGGGYAYLTATQIVFLDQNFNVLGNYVTGTVWSFGIVYSADSSRVFLGNEIDSSIINVIDANSFQLIGQIPGIVDNYEGIILWGRADQNRLFANGMESLGLVDGSVAPTTMPSNTLGTANCTGCDSFTVSDISGYSATLMGAGFTPTPLITFSGFPASNVQFESVNTINLIAPALQTIDQANVNIYFPEGYMLFLPDAYSYKPSVLYADVNAGGIAGGGTLTLWGFGLEYNSQVLIGGIPATNVTENFSGISPYPVPLSYVSATVPAGTMGNADITVTSPLGSVTVPNGFTYAQRTDYPLPSTASPYQMILDKAHDELLWTDPVANQLIVYSLASSSIAQQISLNQPSALAISPDGSQILVVLYGNCTLNVYASGSLTLLKSAPLPFPCTSLIYYPVFVAPVANQKAFVAYSSGYINVYEYDFASNSFSPRSDAGIFGTYMVAASADGSTVWADNSIWNAATDQFTRTESTLSNAAGWPALNADGTVFAYGLTIYGNDGDVRQLLSVHDLMYDEVLTGIVTGQKVNATGSLMYLPENACSSVSIIKNPCIRVFDVRHGNLIKTITLPDGVSTTAIDGMAVDPDGQILYVMTKTGVTTLTFASDPLSVGEVQATGTQLTILGSGFAPGATVQLDGASISASVVDSQHITATAPALSAGGHNITILLPSGDTYSLDNALDNTQP